MNSVYPLLDLVYSDLSETRSTGLPTLAETTIVLKSRMRLEGHFPWPGSAVVNAEYAMTEMGGEYLDALLRIQRTGDIRNNDRGHDPLTELGQCGYMIASGILRSTVPDGYDHLIAAVIPGLSHMHAFANLIYSLACVIKAAYPPYDSEEGVAKQLIFSWTYWHYLVRWHKDTSAAELLLAAAKRFEDKHILQP